MYRRDDPRFRRRLDQFSQNVESATEHAQENLYTFSQNYVTPCFASIGNGLRSCTSCCFPVDDTRRRRQRGRSRGVAESSFDFYDDWDEEENDPLSWTNSSDELDRLLAGPQPGRERAMSYGARMGDGRARRKSITHAGPDPNVITASHYIGFLDRLPFVGRKGLRYKPSAADLQEHPGARRDVNTAIEEEPLMEDSDEETEIHKHRKHKRNRSNTTYSGRTTSSLSSRGDLFPSEDEDDAVPLDDEFDIALERRTTGSGGDGDSRRSRSGKSKSNSRLSIRTVSSKSMHSTEHRTSSLKKVDEPPSPEISSLTDLKLEEERARIEEEQAVEKKREAAKRLALQRGLSSGEESKTETPISTPLPVEELTTVPFPAYDPTAGPTASQEDTDVHLKYAEPPEPMPTSPTLPTSQLSGEPLSPPLDVNSRRDSWV
ncbi:hypothetical protein FKW77_004602 [Venturia effusa]|uniref:Uncharacterized protein n=1 Tax=Venturia effusa TaxID=50376 RepID=A0A517KW72_9PEZI|nr:hypothetical protein FKW77_004602 [Venturia effusa]